MVEVATASVVVLASSPSSGRLLHVFLRVHVVLAHVTRGLRLRGPCRCPSRQCFRGPVRTPFLLSFRWLFL